MEAPPGFEPGMELLQSSALPLGDGAARLRTPYITGERGVASSRPVDHGCFAGAVARRARTGRRLSPPFVTYARRASFAFVCQPGPVARYASTISRSTLRLTSSLVGRFCGPRWPRYRRIASTASVGSVSTAGRARRKSSPVHSGFSASGRLAFFRMSSLLSPIRSPQADHAHLLAA